MSEIFNKLKQAVEDVTTLEVATLTAAQPLNLEPDLNQQDRKSLSDLSDLVITARQQLNASPDNADRQKAYDDALKNLSDKQKQLGVFEPKNIFSRIQAKLGSSENVVLVGYSKYELDGDAVNFINSNADMQDLVASHGKLVESAQQSRTELFKFVKSVAEQL